MGQHLVHLRIGQRIGILGVSINVKTLDFVNDALRFFLDAISEHQTLGQSVQRASLSGQDALLELECLNATLDDGAGVPFLEFNVLDLRSIPKPAHRQSQPQCAILPSIHRVQKIDLLNAPRIFPTVGVCILSLRSWQNPGVEVLEASEPHVSRVSLREDDGILDLFHRINLCLTTTNHHDGELGAVTLLVLLALDRSNMGENESFAVIRRVDRQQVLVVRVDVYPACSLHQVCGAAPDNLAPFHSFFVDCRHGTEIAATAIQSK
mmetsp:Transcript_63838/g.134446  ORF Transcript_63838/g.134446 Transcript_63838/m.134446 type:complete len:265 (+) Transcript_63838:363-1157(+)